MSVVVHDLAAGDAGDSGDADRPPLLIAHATGFHGRAYLPMAEHLGASFRVFGVDFRGHGDTATPDGWHIDWRGYGDDAVAAASALAGTSGALASFGHSMGAAALLMAASRRPDLFGSLVIYEPIVLPPEATPRVGPNPLSGGARRRRATFPSVEEAIANFAGKPPMDEFDPAALDAYVRYGFTPDGDGVRLKCAPEHEAATFEASLTNGVWELLPTIEVPTVVIAGRVDEQLPSRAAEAIADALPHGRYLQVPELDHFGPFTHPATVADLVLDAVASTR